MFSLLLTFFSCKKSISPEPLAPAKDIAYYKERIQIILEDVKDEKTKQSQNSIYNIDFGDNLNFLSTELGELEDGQNELPFYITSFEETSDLNGGLITIINENNSMINLFSVVDVYSTGNFTTSLYAINGTKIGSINVVGGSIVSTDISPSNPEDNNEIITMRSWWACTKDCISDAHIACYMDSFCQTMLFIGNLPNGRIGGQASFSISAACGISCARNVDMDLMPQY